MSMPKLQVPVKCPVCGSELVSELAVTHIANALHDGRPIRLYAQCHDCWWDAAKWEADQVCLCMGTALQRELREAH